MAQGSWVPREVKAKVLEILDNEKGAQLVAKEVHAKLLPWLAEKGYRPYKLRTVQQIITDLGRHAPEETTWSVGVSGREGIPDEAIGDIIKIWQWSVAVGYWFTVREAKWVARLRNAFVNRDDEVTLRRLHYTAAAYAARERAHETLRNTEYGSEEVDFHFFFYVDLQDVWGVIADTLELLGRVDANFERMTAELVKLGVQNRIPAKTMVTPPQYLLIADPTRAIETRLGLTIDHKKPISARQALWYALLMRGQAERTEWAGLSLEERGEKARGIYRDIAERR